ncbi:Acetyltransferase (GNAT) family protein [uncultured archaeon]|nr:Acetyltransferase (GNAT) family protein [uncultured archaeon]
MDLLIRKAVPKDSDTLTKYYIEFKSGHAQYVPKFFLEHRKITNSFESIRSAVKGMILNKGGLFFVVEADGKIVGFAYGEVRTDKRTVFPEMVVGEIKNLWIKDKYRGNRISSKLKDKYLNWFKEKGCDYVLIEVLQKNPANKIYEKWGFEPYLEKLVKPIK